MFVCFVCLIGIETPQSGEDGKLAEIESPRAVRAKAKPTLSIERTIQQGSDITTHTYGQYTNMGNTQQKSPSEGRNRRLGRRNSVSPSLQPQSTQPATPLNYPQGGLSQQSSPSHGLNRRYRQLPSEWRQRANSLPTAESEKGCLCACHPRNLNGLNRKSVSRRDPNEPPLPRSPKINANITYEVPALDEHFALPPQARFDTLMHAPPGNASPSSSPQTFSSIDGPQSPPQQLHGLRCSSCRCLSHAHTIDGEVFETDRSWFRMVSTREGTYMWLRGVATNNANGSSSSQPSPVHDSRFLSPSSPTCMTTNASPKESYRSVPSQCTRDDHSAAPSPTPKPNQTKESSCLPWL